MGCNGSLTKESLEERVCTRPEHDWLRGMAPEHPCWASVHVHSCSYLLCWLTWLWERQVEELSTRKPKARKWLGLSCPLTPSQPSVSLGEWERTLPMIVVNQSSTCGLCATCVARVGEAVGEPSDPLVSFLLLFARYAPPIHASARPLEQRLYIRCVLTSRLKLRR